MKIKEILNDIQYVDDFEDFDVLDISYDSRKVRKGTLFVAIMGQEFDGHDFIEEAEKNGAVAIVKEKGVKSKCKIIEIEVVNTRKVLAKIANNFFQNPSSKIGTVGITGTNGKTTTTFLINKIFNECGNASGSIGTLGFVSPSNIISTGFTTPESLELNNFMDKLVSGGIKNVILEVSSHALNGKHTNRYSCIYQSIKRTFRLPWNYGEIFFREIKIIYILKRGSQFGHQYR